MKKYIKIAFVYAVLAMASGVFYREFTKFNEFTAKTALSVTHLHLFVLARHRRVPVDRFARGQKQPRNPQTFPTDNHRL